MNHIYGHRWSSTNGERATNDDGDLTAVAQTWATGLRSITGEKIAKGLHLCIETGEAWPPSLPELFQFCTGACLNDFHLDYVPEYYRNRETRSERILESDTDKEKRKKSASAAIAVMRKKLAS